MNIRSTDVIDRFNQLQLCTIDRFNTIDWINLIEWASSWDWISYACCHLLVSHLKRRRTTRRILPLYIFLFRHCMLLLHNSTRILYIMHSNVNLQKLLSAHKRHVREACLYTGAISNKVGNSCSLFCPIVLCSPSVVSLLKIIAIRSNELSRMADRLTIGREPMVVDGVGLRGQNNYCQVSTHVNPPTTSIRGLRIA